MIADDVVKEMEGGNGATIGSGITQFAEGEQNIRTVHAYWGAGSRQSLPHNKASRKVRKVREVFNKKAGVPSRFSNIHLR